MNNENKIEYLQKYSHYQNRIFFGHEVNEKIAFEKIFHEVPEKLYRFRKCNNRELKTLENKQLYFSMPSTWPDMLDSRPKYDYKNDILELQGENRTKSIEIFIDCIKKFEYNYEFVRDKKTIDFNEFYNRYYRKNSYDIILYYYNHIKNNTSENVKILINKINKFLLMTRKERLYFLAINNINQTMNAVDNIREEYFMCCFTETYENDSLWENYSNFGNGFCVEYEIRKEQQISNKWIGSIIPILYGDKKPISLVNHLRLMESRNINLEYEAEFLNSQIMKSIFTKGNTYSWEKEWRILGPNINSNCLIDFDYATALYIGQNVNEYYRKRLIKIGNKLNIPIYLRKFDKNLNEWVYNIIN